MADPTKKQTIAVFNHLKAQKANKVGCFSLSSDIGRLPWQGPLRLAVEISRTELGATLTCFALAVVSAGSSELLSSTAPLAMSSACVFTLPRLCRPICLAHFDLLLTSTLLACPS